LNLIKRFLYLSLVFPILLLCACQNDKNSERDESMDSSELGGGGAIFITITAEVKEVKSNRVLVVEVIEPAQDYGDGVNVLLPGVLVTVSYDDYYNWIIGVIDDMITVGTIIEFNRSITLKAPDYLQEPFEVEARGIKVYAEDGTVVLDRLWE